MANKYCRKCGAEMPEDANFCTKCGQPFDPGAISYQERQEKANEEKKINKKAINAFFVVLGVLLLIVLGSMFYSKYSEKIEARISSYENKYSEEREDDSGKIQSDEKVYGNFSNYKETNDCVEGVVVEVGEDDYYMVETKKGYTILERYSGRLDRGDIVRGELNKNGLQYLYNRRRKSEVRVYIKDYALSQNEAWGFIKENNRRYQDSRDSRPNDESLESIDPRSDESEEELEPSTKSFVKIL